MIYIKLFLPPIVIFALTLAWEFYFQEPPGSTAAVISKYGLLIYYLRLDNSGTPQINPLTLTLILMGLGEYFLKSNVLGQILYFVSASVFGVLYFVRHSQKTTKDPLSKIKIALVILFVLSGILSTLNPTNPYGFLPFLIVTMILMFVFLYDRLLNPKQTR